ncbi:M1 family metallopeptidase [Flavobacterium sp. Fl-318]|uniref:M1 family metallopeptidase n=1 Tax=Flavobacterium cupriresistens TaxID=2893885 RepID=A0ABU4RI88_9FLAO|nr:MULTISPECIES: M1 family metallopeptidase [unclassified Flavobacterium]MDX6191230.1 M1 family metallopeptidase [Flavobacterium sp. Fl-318]UFH42451.1 M1 family metallopeptidase [Flavobacterium sp. F-323]
MRKNSLQLLLLGFLFLSQYGFSQKLYMPRNIKEAYENGTRSMDGKPGKKYWQNHGKYTIELTVNADTKVVSGTETIIYENNSNDTLRNLPIRFVNNLHKPSSPRGGDVSEDFLSAGLTITSLKIEGEVYNENARNWGTVGNVKMKKAMLPHSKITINIDWNYPLSKESGREGQIDNTTFFVAYSYPRVTVFDDYNRWDRLPHTDRQEFYNDFNDYTYSVKAPKNYVVYGTGDLLNPDEVLQPEFSSRLKKSYVTDEVLHIANEQEMKSGIVTKQNDWNTWKFEAKNISDVCFGLSDHYLWDASSVVVDKKTNRRASVQAAYDIKGTDFVVSVKNNQYALDWFSNNWPGIPYPFSKMTAFQGFADMEYPMMCNDSQMNDPVFAQLVQDHEVAHTYFPFYMGINETRYAFMDEGWATTFEYLIGIAEHGKEAADKFYKDFRVKQYISDPSTEEDQPIISMSSQLSGAGYGNNSYGKASLSYIALKDLLGDALFKKSLHAYMDNWNGKHPIPWDYFNSMNSASGKNLNWFFNNWFFTNNHIDLAVKSVNAETILVENVGGFAIPFDVNIVYTDDTKETVHQTPAIWEKNQKSATIALKNKKQIKQVMIDGGIFMDATPNNNAWKS